MYGNEETITVQHSFNIWLINLTMDRPITRITDVLGHHVMKQGLAEPPCLFT